MTKCHVSHNNFSKTSLKNKNIRAQLLLIIIHVIKKMIFKNFSLIAWLVNSELPKNFTVEGCYSEAYQLYVITIFKLMILINFLKSWSYYNKSLNSNLTF